MNDVVKLKAKLHKTKINNYIEHIKISFIWSLLFAIFSVFVSNFFLICGAWFATNCAYNFVRIAEENANYKKYNMRLSSSQV